MDVTCNRCGTIYEFEEGLISTTGTTVKCTQCGHLFKVHRRPSVPPVPPGSDPSKDDQLKWRVRRMDGSTHTLDSLAELTRLIGAGQFQRDDEISRTGQIWKKLGEIAELTPLFDAPLRPRRMSDPPPVPRLELARSRRARTPTGSDRSDGDRSRRPSPPEQRFEVLGSEIDLEARRTQPMTPLSEAAAAEVAPLARPPTPPTPSRLDEPDRRAPSEAGATPQIELSEALDPMANRVRTLPLPLLIGLPLVIAAVVGGALLLRPQRLPAAEPSSRAFLIHGDQALAADRTAGFDTAISEYQKALPFFKDDPHILSSISRAYAVWTQELRLQAHFPAEAGGGVGDAGAQEPEARRLADQAKLYGERAAQRNPGNEEASVAFSDALRLTGNLVGARAELDRARATEGVPEAETLRVAALLAIDESDGQAKAGRALAERAVAQDPTLIRARRLLIRCLIADGDLTAARLQLEGLRKIDSEHPALSEIAAELEHVSAVAPKQKRPTTRPESATPPSPAVIPAATGATDQADEHTPIDPKELIRRGEAALERGASQTAERAFQRVLELEPGSPRAKTGLGYVALERSEPQLAITYFRAAAKDGRAEALIGLGDAYRRLGQIRDALGAYQTYLHRYPNGSRSSIARRQSELLSEQLGEGSTGGGNRVRDTP